MLRTALALLVALSCSLVPFGILPSVSRLEVAGAALPVPGQLSSDARTYSVRGTVINSVTGEGIRRALVHTYAGRQRAVLTGPDGKFQFDNLPAGQAWFDVQKPGYFDPRRVRPSERPTMMTVGPDTPAVILKLIPEGVIHGHIMGDNEPIESLQVHLLSERMESGRKVRAEQRALPTNEDGEFRFGDLVPGKYFLFLGPSEGESFSGGALGTRAQGYGSIFYANAADLASATPIEITPGRREEINMVLSQRPFCRVTGTIAGRPFGLGISLLILNDAGQNIGRSSHVDRDTGAFQTHWLPPGSYVIRAFAQDNKTRQSFSAFAPLRLDSDVSGLNLTLAQETNISASIRIESTRHDTGASRGQSFIGFSSGFTPGFGGANSKSPAAFVSLIAQEPTLSRMRRGAEPVNDESGSLVLRNIPPGTYTVEINPAGPYYVTSARSGFLDLLREPLTVGAGGSVQPIEIVLRDDFASLEGKVSYDAADSAYVLAIPEEAPQHAQHQVTSQPRDVYSFQQLAPGPYKVVALDNIDGFEYANPEVVRKYSSKMRDVTLYPNQKATVDLELARLGE